MLAMTPSRVALLKNPSLVRVLALLCFFQIAGFRDDYGPTRQTSESAPDAGALIQPVREESELSFPGLSPEQARIVRAVMNRKKGYSSDSAETLAEFSQLQSAPCSWSNIVDGFADALETNATRAKHEQVYSLNTYNGERHFDRYISITSNDSAGINLKEISRKY